MGIKVYYFGPDLPYWEKLKKRFDSSYEGAQFDFKNFKLEASHDFKQCFKVVYDGQPDIIYIDFSTEEKQAMRLAKTLTKNNELRQLSLVGLFSPLQDYSLLYQSLNASVRINHIKSNEIGDVVYDPMSFMDVNQAIMPEYIRSNPINDFEILLPLRVGYIQDNRFHIETNAYLEEGQIVHVESHPLSHIMPSTKVYVEKFYDRNFYFNKRFAYDLEFIYVDNDFFAATDENWKVYKLVKDDPEKVAELDPEVADDLEARRRVYKGIKDKIDEWMQDRQGQKVSKKLKIMCFDEELVLFDDVIDSPADFKYTLSHQTLLTDDAYQIQRSMPHLILFGVGKKNSIEKVKTLIEKIKTIEDYDPFIVVFSEKENLATLKSSVKYSHLLTYSHCIEFEDVKNMAIALDQKLDITNEEHKVFISSKDPNMNIFMKRKIRINAMTESVAYIESEVEIPMWTVFAVKSPVRMLLTVVPHKDNQSAASPNEYRCLINGATEEDKANIRKLINATLDEGDDVEVEPTEDEKKSEDS